MKNHGLLRNHMALIMRHELGIMDQMLLYDGYDVINSASAGMLCRRCHGLELVFEDVHCESDWKTKDPKNSKAKLTLLDDYDITAIMARGERATEADATVRKQMELRAKFAKYLSKQQALQQEGPA